MAITLYQTPRAYINQLTSAEEQADLVLFAGDPCVFVVEEDAIGTYKFGYTCLVEFREPGQPAYSNILTLRVQKNTNNCGIFDLGNVLQSLTPTTVALKPFQTSDFVRSSNSYGDVRLTFGSEQAVNAVSPATPNASTTQYSGVVRNGGTYIYAQFKATDNLSSGQYAVELRTGYDCTNPSHIVMTTSVERKYQQGKPYPDAPVFFVNDTDYLYIEGWKAKELSDTLFTTRWKLELYEGSTLLGDDTFNMPNTGDFAVGNYQPCRFFCCPYYMSQGGGLSIVNWPGDTRLTTVGNENWTSYRVRLEDTAGAAQSNWSVFNRYNYCTGERQIRFAFVNRFGATDFMTTRGKWTNSHNIKRSEFTRTLGNYSTATGRLKDNSGSNDSEWGFNVSDRGRTAVVTEREQVWTANTGPLNAYETSVFMSMINSGHVFAQDIRTYDQSGQPYQEYSPVVIRTDSMREVQPLGSQVSEYTFELVYARDNAQANFGAVNANLSPIIL